jgi:hypothetical protein
MARNPILDLSLNQVMRSEIALSLQVLKIHTVGALLYAWRNPKNQRNIEQIFDSPEQARHALCTCSAWLGVVTPAIANPVPAWWLGDAPAAEGFSAVVLES